MCKRFKQIGLANGWHAVLDGMSCWIAFVNCVPVRIFFKGTSIKKLLTSACAPSHGQLPSW